MGKDKICYVAYPTRMKDRGQEICEFIRQKLKCAPVDPFAIGSYEDFEGGVVGRRGTLEFTMGLQKLCGLTAVFGVSDGVMQELRDRLQWDSEKNIRVFDHFDPLFGSEYEKLKKNYGDLLSQLRGQHHLIVLVGPSAIGKTYWSAKLIQRLNGKLQYVRNATTRSPRSHEEQRFYNFISREEFEERIMNDEFLEYDQYLGNYYGSSLKEIKNVLKSSHGIAAYTPKGVEVLYACRYEINLTILLLKPSTESMLIRNFERRVITDVNIQQELLEKAAHFVLPSKIPHSIIEMYGDDEDEKKLLACLWDVFQSA